MINELLSSGAGHARTGKEIANLLGVDIRTITEQIERERRAGQPICASMNGGYYLAANREELQAYCDCIKGRAIEIFKTRQALIKVIDLLPAADQDNPGGLNSARVQST